MSKENVNRKISIFVNDKEVQNSLRSIGSAVSHVNKEMRNLNKDSEAYDQELKKLQTTHKELTTRMTAMKNEISGVDKKMVDVNDQAGKVKNTFNNIFTGITTGNLNLVTEGFSGIKGAISGMTKAALAFIATPIGVPIAALVALGTGAKKLFDYNTELGKMNKELKALAVSSEEISAVRSEIQATAETFGYEFKDLAQKANSIAKNYGISISEANKLIAEGLANGGKMSTQFLENIAGFANDFADAGYAAKEFMDILNTGFEMGIAEDKLAASIKTAQHTLLEQSETTKNGLINAFGAPFTQEILSKVRLGELTTKEALERMAQKSQEIGLSQRENLLLTTGLFKKAGHEAGGAKLIFEALGKATERDMSKSAQSVLKLQQATEKLHKAQADLLEIDGLGSAWTTIKIVGIDALTALLHYIKQVKQDMQPLIDLVAILFVGAWHLLKSSVIPVFEIMIGLSKTFSSLFIGLINSIITLLMGDFKGALEALMGGFEKMAKYLANIFIGLYNHVLTTTQKLIDLTGTMLNALGVNIDKLKAKLESFKKTKFEIQGTITTEDKTKPKEAREKDPKAALREQQKMNEEAKKERKNSRLEKEKEDEKEQLAKEKAAKEERDRLLALSKARSALAKAELDHFLINHQTKRDKSEKLTIEMVKEERTRLQKIKDQQIKALKEEKEEKNKRAVLEIQEQEQLDLVKKAIEEEHLTAVQKLDLDFHKNTDALKNQYDEEQKIWKAEQLALENELALVTAQTKYEQERIAEEQRFQAELARYKKLLEDKKITQDQYNTFVVTATKDTANVQHRINLTEVNDTLQGVSVIANAYEELFGQTKALATAQATINGALAVTSILSAASMGNPIFDAAVKAIQIAGVIKTTGDNIKKINLTQPPKAPKFFYGGDTGDTAIAHDRYGKITGYVHDNEYVIPKAMTQNPRYADTLTWLENERIGMKGYFDGGHTSDPPTPPKADLPIQEFIQVIDKLDKTLEKGIVSKTYIGYEEVEKINDLNQDITNSKQNGIL